VESGLLEPSSGVNRDRAEKIKAKGVGAVRLERAVIKRRLHSFSPGLEESTCNVNIILRQGAAGGGGKKVKNGKKLSDRVETAGDISRGNRKEGRKKKKRKVPHSRRGLDPSRVEEKQ